MLNDQDSSMAANAICHAVSMMQESFRYHMAVLESPHILYKAEITKAASGEGYAASAHYVVGYGATPNQAMADFDKKWMNG